MSDLPVIQESPPSPSPPVAAGGPLPFVVRMWCGFVLAVCVGMLGVGLYLTPSPTGTGTHTQLGMARCEFYAWTRIPCPTCGCTTAVSHFSHGHILTSLLTQPFGFAVALAAFLMLPLTAVGVVTGKWYGPSMFTVSWYWRWWVYGGVGIFLGGWVYKILLVWLTRQ
ncbi:MAG: DUF2752 domain-containing protein [Phycisphaerales bacterium]|nr:DUF2752 domain-containing protein [Phycisphaerales bacterium]